MSNNFSLINLDLLGDIGVGFINTIAKATGWVANRETPKKIAVNTFIEDIQKTDMDPVSRAVLIANANKLLKEYCNQEAIITKAIGYLKCDSKYSEVDVDWLNQFMDKARLVSDDEFQLIWAKILAEECNYPNSVPKSLLSTLSQMDRRDAVAFTKICSVSIYVEDDRWNYSPMIFSNQIQEYYNMLDMVYNDFVDLQALGLIETSFAFSDNTYAWSGEIKPVKIHYFSKEIELPDGMDTVSSGNVMFTKTGQALCKAITTEERMDFWEKYCLPSIEKDIVRFNNGGKVLD